jgi:hypothetical protein
MSEIMAAEHALDKSKMDPGLDMSAGIGGAAAAVMGGASKLFRL